TGDPVLSLSGSDSAYWEVFYGDAIADRQTFTIDDSDRLDIRVAGWAYVGIVSGRVTSADGDTDYSDNYRIYTAGNYAASGRELSEFQGILQVQRKQLAYTRNDTAVTVAGDSEFAYNGNAHAVKIVLANGATPVVADLFDFDTAQLPDGHSVVLESVSGTSVGTQALLLKFRILNERGENVTKAFFMQTHREDAISITVRKAELSIDTAAGIRVALEGRNISPFMTEEDGSEVYRLTDKNYLRVSAQENGVVAYSVYRIADGVEIEGYEALYYSVTVNGVLMQSEQEETL
ncbi:MAG: hypothetical protein K2L51_02255, partial [Clostridiales bacterium]|nr:hypothetical protein [Clostridiales bacterium]